MNITIEELSAILCSKPKQTCNDAAPFTLGKNYFIRTVTHHHTGVLVAVYPTELVLEQACWIPDDGRFEQALQNSEFNEVEPFPVGAQVIIGRGSIVDAVQINSIPKSQK